MMSIFISRKLEAGSILRKQIGTDEAVWSDQSLIEFKAVEFIPPSTAWLFFYSRQGVKFFKSGMGSKHDWNQYKWAAFGPGTASEIFHQLGIKATYSGSSDPEQISRQLLSITKSEEITFVRGVNSRKSVQRTSQEWNNSPECIVYDNQPLKNVQLDHFDIAILTSPMNAKTFIANGGNASHFVAIGQPTFNQIVALKEDAMVLKAEEPSEESIANTLKTIMG